MQMGDALGIGATLGPGPVATSASFTQLNFLRIPQIFKVHVFRGDDGILYESYVPVPDITRIVADFSTQGQSIKGGSLTFKMGAESYAEGTVEVLPNATWTKGMVVAIAETLVYDDGRRQAKFYGHFEVIHVDRKIDAVTGQSTTLRLHQKASQFVGGLVSGDLPQVFADRARTLDLIASDGVTASVEGIMCGAIMNAGGPQPTIEPNVPRTTAYTQTPVTDGNGDIHYLGPFAITGQQASEVIKKGMEVSGTYFWQDATGGLHLAKWPEDAGEAMKRPVRTFSTSAGDRLVKAITPGDEYSASSVTIINQPAGSTPRMVRVTIPAATGDPVDIDDLTLTEPDTSLEPGTDPPSLANVLESVERVAHFPPTSLDAADPQLRRAKQKALRAQMQARGVVIESIVWPWMKPSDVAFLDFQDDSGVQTTGDATVDAELAAWRAAGRPDLDNFTYSTAGWTTDQIEDFQTAVALEGSYYALFVPFGHYLVTEMTVNFGSATMQFTAEKLDLLTETTGVVINVNGALVSGSGTGGSGGGTGTGGGTGQGGGGGQTSQPPQTASRTYGNRSMRFYIGFDGASFGSPLGLIHYNEAPLVSPSDTRTPLLVRDSPSLTHVSDMTAEMFFKLTTWPKGSSPATSNHKNFDFVLLHMPGACLLVQSPDNDAGSTMTATAIIGLYPNVAGGGYSVTPTTVGTFSLTNNDDTWHHLAMQWEPVGGWFGVWLDGVLQVSDTVTSFTGDIGLLDPPTVAVMMALEPINYTGVYPLALANKGDISVDFVRFSNTARYAHSNFTAPTAGFACDDDSPIIWPCRDLRADAGGSWFAQSICSRYTGAPRIWPEANPATGGFDYTTAAVRIDRDGSTPPFP